MKKVIAILLSLLFVFALVACGNGSGNTDTDTSTNTDTETDTGTGGGNKDTQTDSSGGGNTTDTGSKPVDPEKPAPPVYESTTVEDELKSELGVFDAEDTYGNEGSIIDYVTTNQIDVSRDAYNKQAFISEGGAYRVFGTSTDGQIYVSAPDQDVVLIFDGVSLTSGNSVVGPAIFAVDCASVTIVLVEGKENYLADNSANDGEGAVIRVRSCNLTIEGKGSLTVEGKAKNAIANTKELTINSGTFNISAKNGHGIYGKKGLNINGGKFNIDAGKSGFKSGDGDDTTSYEYGFINVNSGSISISSGTNGFNCIGPVSIKEGRVSITAENGNGIDALEDVKIGGGTMIINSYKSAIATDGDVEIKGASNLKLTTTGNGISAENATVDTDGVIYIKTTPVYEKVTAETSATKTRYVFVDDAYVIYDAAVHGKNATLFVLRDSKGFEVTELTIKDGIIGIDSFQDCINTERFAMTDGKLVLFTASDAIDASVQADISEKAEIDVLGSEKGIKAEVLNINGGTLNIVAEKDAINTSAGVMSDGVVYLFDKIDLGTDGTMSVNGGVLLVVSTTDNKQATTGDAPFISALVTEKESALAGNYLKVINGADIVLVELPKDYTEKMAVYYASSNIDSNVMIVIGSCDADGMFTAIYTQTVK